MSAKEAIMDGALRGVWLDTSPSNHQGSYLTFAFAFSASVKVWPFLGCAFLGACAFGACGFCPGASKTAVCALAGIRFFCFNATWTRCGYASWLWPRAVLSLIRAKEDTQKKMKCPVCIAKAIHVLTTNNDQQYKHSYLVCAVCIVRMSYTTDARALKSANLKARASLHLC